MKSRKQARTSREHVAAEHNARGAIIRDFFKGLGFIVIIIIITSTFEHRPTGEHLASLGYEYLQSHLVPHELPVAIVDISHVSRVKIDDGVPREVTSRSELKQIINAVADQGATAIGVDVNFAPLDDGTFLTPDDPDFFQFCRDLKTTKGVSVILAVDWISGDGIPRNPEVLIENEDYTELVGGIRNPRNPAEMPYEMSYTAADKTFKVPMMSAAIAKKFKDIETEKHRLPNWMAKQFSEQEADGMNKKDFAVDFSPIKLLESRDNTLRPGDVDIIQKQGSILRGKIVLIGRVLPGEDQFNVPGQGNELFPGVYLHACAIYTLLKAPLLRVTWAGGIFLDFVLAFIVLAALTGVRWYFKYETRRHIAKHRLEKLFTTVVALLAFVSAVWFVNYHRVIWQDYIIVIPMLFLHRPIEDLLRSGWSFLKRKTPEAVEAIVFEEERNQQ